MSTAIDHLTPDTAPMATDVCLDPPETVLDTLMFVTSWVGLQDDAVIHGLRHPADAVRLWSFADRNPGMSRYVDEWPRHTVTALIGYHPAA